MNQLSDLSHSAEVSPGPANPRSSIRSRRFGLLVITGIGLASLIAVGLWRGMHRKSVEVPEVVSENPEDVLDSSIRNARNIVLKFPESALSWGNYGQSLSVHGFDDLSQHCFRKAMELDPHDMTWPYLLAIGILLEQPEAAVPLLEQAVNNSTTGSPDGEIAQVRLANVLLKLGHVERARSLYQQVVEQNPGNIQAKFDLGLIEVQQSAWRKAEAIFHVCIDSPFTRRKSRVQLCAIAQRLGHTGEAQRLTRETESLPEDLPFPDPIISRMLNREFGRQRKFSDADRLEREGRLREAIPILESLVAEQRDAVSLLALALARAKLQDLRGAEQILLQAAELAPGQAQVHYHLAVVLFSQIDPHKQTLTEVDRELLKRAIGAADECLKIRPEHGLARLFQGQANQRLGRIEDALAAYRYVKQIRPDIPQTYALMASALIDQGQLDAALLELETAKQRLRADDALLGEVQQRVRNFQSK